MSPANEPPYAASGGMIERVQAYQAVVRRWSKVLDAQSQLMLLHLVDMTIGWGQTEVATTVRQLCDGRRGRGEWEKGGFGFGRSAAFKALDTLREWSLIETRNRTNPENGVIEGLMIRVDADILLQPWEITAMPPVIREPKRLKSDPSATRMGVVRNTDGGSSSGGRTPSVRQPHNTDTFTSNLTDTFNDGATSANASVTGSATASPEARFAPQSDLFVSDEPEVEAAPEKIERVSAREAAARSMAKSGARRATVLQETIKRVNRAIPLPKDRKTSKLAGIIKADDLETVWQATWHDAFRDEDMPCVWSKQERGQAMLLFGRWPRRADGTRPNGDFSDFLIYAVTEWRSITARLSNLRRPAPVLPTVGFLQAFFDHFQECYLTQSRRKVLTRLDIDEVEELTAKGMSHAAALETIARRKVQQVSRAAAPRQKPAPLPAARPRARPPVQPVATESGLPAETAKPTRVTRHVEVKRSAAEIEADLWGTRDK